MKYLNSFFLFLIICSNSANSQIMFSEYSEGTSYNKYIEIYNYSSEVVNLSSEFVLASCTNGCIDGTNFYINEFPEDAVISPGDVYVVAATQADQLILNEADYVFQYCCGNGDDAYALMLAGTAGDVFDSNNALDIIGDEDTWQEGFGWDVAGVEQATKNHTLVRKSSVITSNSGNWSSSAGTDSNNSEWIVLEIDDWSNLGFHNYDNNSSNNIFGCMCDQALNYSVTATVDDGSCVVDGGCSDALALNYSGDLCLSAEFVNEDCQYETIEISGCYDDGDIACNGFNFEYQITASNMTIAVVDISNLIIGDILGVFYIDENGFVSCGGASSFEGEPIALAAWNDDTATTFIDGFQENDQLIFLLLRDGLVYDLEVTLNNLAPFSNTYITNGFGQISSLYIGGVFIQDCIFPNLGYDCDGNSIQITENELEIKKMINTVDILGRSLSSINNQELRIIIYSDGTVEKKYYLNH